MAKKAQKKVAAKKVAPAETFVSEVDETEVVEAQVSEASEAVITEDDAIESPVVFDSMEDEVALTPEEEEAMQSELYAQAALEDVRSGWVEATFVWSEKTWAGLTRGMGIDVRVTLGLIGLMLGGVGLYYLVPSLAQVDFGMKARSLVLPLHKSLILKSFFLGLWIYLSVRMVTDDSEELSSAKG
jgi:hypothetical protein